MDDVGKNLKVLERKIKRLEKENLTLRFRVEQVEILWRNANESVHKTLEEMDKLVMETILLQEKIDEL